MVKGKNKRNKKKESGETRKNEKNVVASVPSTTRPQPEKSGTPKQKRVKLQLGTEVRL